MTRETTDTCASCVKFPMQQAQENGGKATCSIFEREQHYSDRACGPLYERDRINLDARRRAVIRLTEAQTKENPDA